MADVKRKSEQGLHVLGVCNGFQMLCEAGLLPGVLMRNNHLKFVCRHVKLETANADTAFTNKYKQGEVWRCPVAHGDGNYFTDAETLARLEGENRSEEHTSELQSLMRISYDVFCLNTHIYN